MAGLLPAIHVIFTDGDT